MITLETLRAGLLAPDPYNGIDRLIQAELAAGRKTQAVHDDLFPLVETVRQTPGFTEDAGEALFGALDALQGRVHPSCAYRDPPEQPTVPTPPLQSTSPSGSSVEKSVR
ncbi:MAG: hypothetical protein K2P78_09300 [Gemmataceae bacterium]|nr:hypothetical protein [Gemmataceae bacterium]